MNAKRMTLMVASLVVAAAAGLFSRPASAGVTVRFQVGGSYGTYQEWQTVTRYRTVRRAVTRIVYRTEKQTVTTYETRRELVEESYRDNLGFYRTRQVWQTVRVPVTEVRYVEVPYEETVYEYVQEPYTESVLVETSVPRYYSSVRIVPQFSIRLGSHRSRPVYTHRTVQRPTAVHRSDSRRSSSHQSGSSRSGSRSRSSRSSSRSGRRR
jgi:hypothetical protein